MSRRVALAGRKFDFDSDFDFEEKITDAIVLKSPVERVSRPVPEVVRQGGEGGKIVAD